VLAYVGITVLLVLLMAPLAFLALRFGLPILMAVVWPLMKWAPALMLVPVVLLWTLLTWLWFRMALVLPASAVGRPIGVADSWRATRRADGAIFLMGGALIVLSWGLRLVFPAQFVAPWVALLAAGAIHGLTVMLGISVLTTLHGHLVEGRPLSGTQAVPVPNT
jgi:hypothetical protein